MLHSVIFYFVIEMGAPSKVGGVAYISLHREKRGGSSAIVNGATQTGLVCIVEKQEVIGGE